MNTTSLPTQLSMPSVPSFEQSLGGNIFTPEYEKTFIDKVLGRREVEELKDIMEKDELDRSDLNKLLYLLSSVEIKLVNFGEWDRYLLGKFYAWIRDFVATLEILFDYQKMINEGKVSGVSESTRQMLQNIQYKQSHNVKFLADVFLYLSRSTLSYRAMGFDTLTSQRFEYSYPNQSQGGVAPEAQNKGFLSKIVGR